MDPLALKNKTIFQWSVVHKFILYILVFSSVITLILTAIQLYMDYRYGLDSIEESALRIEASHLDGIINSLWVSDNQLLQMQLDGMLKLSDIQYIDVVHNNKTLAKAGEFQNKHVIKKEFSLPYTYRDKTISLGKLRVVYTLKDLYQRLKNKVIVIIITQSIKTFIVSGFIFFIFYFLVARHIHALANYSKLLDLKSLGKPFVLERDQNKSRKDEFDLVVDAVNEMRVNLNDSYQRLEFEIQERKQVENTLRESESQFSSIYNESPIGIELYDSQGTLLDANPKCLEIFGIRNAEAVKGFKLFEDPNISDENKNRLLSGGQVKFESEFDFDKVRELALYETSKTGKNFVEVFVTPWKTAAAGENRFLVHVTDITQRKQIEKELENHREHLEELVEGRTEELKEKTDKIEKSRKALIHLLEDVNESRDALQKVNIEFAAVNNELKEFAYIVSHDLKAPLRAISQLSQWISEDYAHLFDNDGKMQMELIIKRAKRMDELIDGILRYSRIGRIREKEESLDLNLLVKEVIESIAPPDHVKIIIKNKLPVVARDSIRMEQVFQNLIGNAIKFMDKDEGIVTVDCLDKGTFWEFSIFDNGPGIDKRYHDKIFQIFQTLTARDEHESTGIGLTLVKKIIHLYGGIVWVESQTGQGATFFFTLSKKGETYEKL